MSKTPAQKTLRYLYDFGDGWDHTVKIERLLDLYLESAIRGCSKPAGDALPKMLAGHPAYAETLEAISDPKHERHKECKEWMPENFDPALVNVEWIADELAILAKRWSRKPAKRSKAN